MKKKVFLIITVFLMLFIVTGCGSKEEGKSNGGGGIINTKKTLVCTKEEVDEDGYKTVDTMEVTYKGDKVLRVKSTTVTETDPTYLEFTYNILNAVISAYNELDGITTSCTKKDNNKVEMIIDVEYDKINPEQIKSTLGELYSEEESFYDKKEYTIDEFKTKNLEGFTCN